MSIMKRRAAFIGLVAFATAVSAQSVDVSLISLIATPREFDGKQVRVIGFARLEFEGNAIYLHREDYLQGITKNGLWLDVERLPKKSAASANNQYVIVEGVFSMTDKGHLGLWSGSIQKVTRMDPWSAPK
ncbi:hypothetical protein J2X20_005653 [Pelomonas saccharophila]|uniref:Uncharacterized protein n=1 Tax=Roseateles saccharophilus TaxID=304 RepID=A0ABU1YW62_ROSSA|nr:hypothetical protein [Roseateles saccharophilus]MDR7272968.1 hypothetical protein [Roseateles saccharophilus]